MPLLYYSFMYIHENVVTLYIPQNLQHQKYVDANPGIDPRFIFVNLGYNLNYYKNKNIFEFAHLLGMNQNYYDFLVNKNYYVNVYIPYGPYRYTIPYLTRRLYENLDYLKYMF